MSVILTIAGSDPSGGAGIQADLKTFTTLGCYGAAAITAITCQNTLGVSQCHPLPPQLVVDQVSAVLSDMAPSHIKIGMTATAGIIAALAALLKDFKGEIIFDPVLRSSAGQSLLHGDEAMPWAPLLAIVTVLTPNISELSRLSGLPVTTEAEAHQAGQALMARHATIRALCIKGGHLNEEEQEVVDILLEKNEGEHPPRLTRVSHPRRHTRNSHGTGCTFASAFAAYHSRTHQDRQAFEAAVAYVDTLLAMGRTERIGHGQGPLPHHRWHQVKAD